MLKDYNVIKKSDFQFKKRILKFPKLRKTVTSASLGGVLPEALKKFKKKVAGFPYRNNNCCIIKQKHRSEIL